MQSVIANFNELSDKCTLKYAKKFMKERGLKILFFLSLINMLLVLFSLKTLLSAASMIFITFQIIHLKWRKLRKEGFVNYFPNSLKTLMMKRSIFDVLCDVWFYPRLSLIIKAVVTPFLISIEPENAINQLENLSDIDRKLILTKGVVYILPKSLKKLFLPKKYKLQTKIHEFMESESETEKIDKVEDDQLAQNSDSFLSVTKTVQMLEKTKDRPNAEKLDYSKKNKVIISSKMLKFLDHFPGKVSDKWDNLNQFRRTETTKKNSLKRSFSIEDDSVHSGNRKSDFSEHNRQKNSKPELNAISMVMNLIEVKKQKLLKKLSKRTLAILLSVSILIFTLKLGLSPRYRKITRGILMTASYAAVLGLGMFSLSAIIMKSQIEKASLVQRPILSRN